ncbi:DUF262 domain-containing protein [Spiroplasma alleghenense]|uniref:DUF262 domain-containing protein n=1 Tax=Spiroplasma alleghenense TaxID=216931 RepID=A0A345Z4U8_9MOLU|nr:DUF262 domain-containing protein [Spiroplasma alleghenense]AXK51627.1 hypothetical protein SALLE_v1c09570 [Spiroplasma alleghenense]
MNEYIQILTKPSENAENEREMYTFHDIFHNKDLNQGKINIPIFQRNYSWSEEQLVDFSNEYDKYFESFLKEASNDMPTYDQQDEVVKKAKMTNNVFRTFFGPIYILKQQSALTKIIDGQQRITTLYIFLIAQWSLLKRHEKEFKNLINNIEETKLKKRASEMLDYFSRSIKELIFMSKNNDKLFGNSKFETENLNDKNVWENLFKIIDGKPFLDKVFDDNFSNFKEFQLSLSNDLKNTKKNSSYKSIIDSKIFNAFIYAENYFLSKIKKIEENNYSEIDYLQKINSPNFTLLLTMFMFTFDISEYFQIGVFNIKKEDQISKIFENINSKGTQLTPFDLLKNAIYQSIKKSKQKFNEEEFAQQIEEIENLIIDSYKSLDNNEYLLDFYKGLFLNHLKKVEDVNKANIFERVSQVLKNDDRYKENPCILLRDLQIYFKNYCEIFPKNPEEYSIGEDDRDLDFYNCYRVINNLNFKVLKSMLIGMHTAIDRDDSIKNSRELKNKATNFVKKLSYIYLINLNCYDKKANWHDNKFREISKEFLKSKDIYKALINLNSKKDDENNILEDPLFKSLLEDSEWNKYIQKLSEEVEDIKSELFKDNGASKAILQDLFFFSASNKHEIIKRKYELEHILPIKQKESKNKIENYDTIKFSIGNMILLKKKLNAKLSNCGFEDKKGKVYSNQEYIDETLFGVEEKIFKKLSVKQLKVFKEEEIVDRNKVISELLKKALINEYL